MSTTRPGGYLVAVMATAAIAAVILPAIVAGRAEGAADHDVATAIAEDDTATVDWRAQPPSNGELLEGPGGQTAVRVTGTGEPATIELARLDGSLVSRPTFTVSGEVRFSDVSPPGYLELLVAYPGGEQYFSQWLTPDGTGALDGSSGWQDFELPFSGAVLPAELTLNVVLAGTGTVDVGPLEVVSLDSREDLAGEDAWWPERTGGFIGAIGGSAIGLISAAYGVAIARGRHRRFVLASAKLVLLAGLGLLAAAAVALFEDQPYAVWFPLLLLGIYPVGLAAFVLIFGRRAYASRELQRMRAMDSV